MMLPGQGSAGMARQDPAPSALQVPGRLQGDLCMWTREKGARRASFCMSNLLQIYSIGLEHRSRHIMSLDALPITNQEEYK